jgi:hypothetical protein
MEAGTSQVFSTSSQSTAFLGFNFHRPVITAENKVCTLFLLLNHCVVLSSLPLISKKPISFQTNPQSNARKLLDIRQIISCALRLPVCVQNFSVLTVAIISTSPDFNLDKS